MKRKRTTLNERLKLLEEGTIRTGNSVNINSTFSHSVLVPSTLDTLMRPTTEKK